MNSTSPSIRVDSIAARSPARSIAGPAGDPEGRAQLGGDDHGEAGLAQPRRPGQQHVVRRPAAPQRAVSTARAARAPGPGRRTRSSRLGRSALSIEPLVARRRGRDDAVLEPPPGAPVPRLRRPGVRPAHRPASAPRAPARSADSDVDGTGHRRPPCALVSSGLDRGMACVGVPGRQPRIDQACATWSRQTAAGRRRLRRPGGPPIAGGPILSLSSSTMPLRALACRCRGPGSAPQVLGRRRPGAARRGRAPPAWPGPAGARRRWRSAAARRGSARRRRRSRTGSASPRGPPGWWPAGACSPSRSPASVPGVQCDRAGPTPPTSITARVRR